ncbi:MAG: NIPSNAP family protein [Ignavibacteriaceae bacterium]|jgi:hypothetical protein
MNVLKLFFVFIAILILLSQSSGMAQQLGEKVYWMSTVEVSMSKLQSYYTFNANELIPLMEEHGYTPVASWQTIVGDIEEVIFVAEFENMEAYHNARKSLLSSIDWTDVSRKLDSLIKSIHTKLLSAAPF